MTDAEDPEAVTESDLFAALDALSRPYLTTAEFASRLDVTSAAASRALDTLSDEGSVRRHDVPDDATLWYPPDLSALTDRGRVVVFPDRREVVLDGVEQFTRARLAQFAHLVDTNREGAAIYEVRPEDVWFAPYETFEDLRGTMRDVLGGRYEDLESWVRSQWDRARTFRLYTHEEGYTVLAARSDDLMGNVARPKLGDALRAPIADDESWVDADRTAEVKRTLYEAGYPVRDERDLDTGAALSVDLTVSLRPYQEDWVERFLDRGAGVFVGPPGSGKTIAALGVLRAVGGETLILVPSRQLVTQWREALARHTTLADDEVGEYHGGTKQLRPVTIATYRTAGMDRHRALFEERGWGLVVYDEVHHVPADVYRRTADLQSKHRLGLTATPTREADDEEEIFTLVGPPIGTDWSALFDAGYVQEPEIRIRLVPWGSDEEADQYGAASGHAKRRAAAENSAKVAEVNHLLAEHPHAKALVFVEYLDQGEDLAAALDAPFVSGEMPHARREKRFEEFRSGRLDTLVVSRVGDEGVDLPDAELAILASGLGGSRRQGAQRAGRTMRPAGEAHLYVLATRGTEEEDFVRRQMRHLASKGVRVSESGSGIEGDRDGVGPDRVGTPDPDAGE